MGTAFRYGAEVLGQEVVDLYDPAVRRYRYIKPLAAPVEGDGTVHWPLILS